MRGGGKGVGWGACVFAKKLRCFGVVPPHKFAELHKTGKLSSQERGAKGLKEGISFAYVVSI